MHLDTSGWSGEGTFTELLVAALRDIPAVEYVRIEDAPASRADSLVSFISNEVYVRFARFGLLRGRRPMMTLAQLETVLGECDGIGAPDYSDEGMLQYLKAERIVPPYQTRGYKLVELVRIYAC